MGAGIVFEQVTRDSLAQLSSELLTARLAQLAKEERERSVEFLWLLAEMDRRGTCLELGYGSVFDYCTQALRLPTASAWRRMTAARLLTRFPAAAPYIADGRLNLTTFVALRNVLEPENHAELLDRASGLSGDAVKVLVASLDPQPALTDMIRRLPARTLEPAVAASSHSAPPAAIASPVPSTVAAEVIVPSSPPPELKAHPPTRARIEALDAERHAIRMTVGKDFMTELAQVKAALSHAVPDGNLEQVFRACFHQTLTAYAKRRGGVPAAPNKEMAPNPEPAANDDDPEHWSRYVPMDVRRAVWARDGGRCTFVGEGGHRCESTYQLELDHDHPAAWGGKPTVANLFLRCRAHNLHRAKKHFGDEFMARFLGPR